MNSSATSITRVALVAALPFIACSCACIFNGTKQQIQINSNPAGADISINGIPYGKTPNYVTLARDETYQVQFTKNDYMSANQAISHRLSGWFWLDLICETIPGLVDLGVGSAYVLEPESVNAQLLPLKESAEANPAQTLLDAKKLLDEGVISKEEFEAIKAKSLPNVIRPSLSPEQPSQPDKPSNETIQKKGAP